MVPCWTLDWNSAFTGIERWTWPKLVRFGNLLPVQAHSFLPRFSSWNSPPSLEYDQSVPSGYQWCYCLLVWWHLDHPHESLFSWGYPQGIILLLGTTSPENCTPEDLNFEPADGNSPSGRKNSDFQFRMEKTAILNANSNIDCGICTVTLSIASVNLIVN